MGKIKVPELGDEKELLIDGKHKGIISEKLFYKVQSVLEMNKTRRNITHYKTQREELPLRGLLYCSKCNCKMTGSKSKSKNGAQEIAKMTIKCLKENVPKEVPGIAFLSGGQTEVEATQNLNEINKINDTNFLISFSYGRALQQSALKHWGKNIEDLKNTQKIFNHRSKMNSLSTSAKWSAEQENI